MHLESVTLHNFRCFDDLQIPLHPRLTVLVAENAGGKTSVLDAIAIALAPLLRAFSSAAQRIGEGEDILPSLKDTDFRLVERPSRRNDELSTWVPSDEARVSLKTVDGLSWSVGRTSTGTTSDPSSPPAVPLQLLEYASTIQQQIRAREDWLLPVIAYYGANRSTFEIPDRLRDSRLNYDYPTSALVGALNPATDFKELLKWFDLEEASALRAMRAAGDPEHYPAQPALSCVRESLAMLLGEEYTDPQFNARHKLVVTARNGPKELQVAQLSQGYQSMLALGMDFARRLAIANPGLEYWDEHKHWKSTIDPLAKQFHPEPCQQALIGPAWAPALMLIDEVDLHLHPSWQQRVLSDLMRAFPMTQFIVTTHSPQVLTTVKPESIRILRRDANGQWIADEEVPNAYGHSNSRSLEALMGGQAYPEHLQTVSDLREYQRLVGADQHDLPRALELRKNLEAVWGPRDPELQLVDVAIRKNEALRQFRSQQK